MKQHRPRLSINPNSELCDVCHRRIVWVEQREHCAAHLRHAPRTKGRFTLAPTLTNSYDSVAGSSSESARIANDARVSATTRSAGVVASTGGSSSQ